MFLKTLEKLASEHHDLRVCFETIDRLVASNPKVLLDVNEIASESCLSLNKTLSAFGLSSQKGVLSDVEFVECRKCQQLLKLEATECSQCESSKISKDRRKFWRLSEMGKRELDQSPSYLAGFPWSDDVGFYRGKVDAVVVTIKSEEFTSVLKRFPVEHTVVGRRHYNFCRIKSLHVQTYLVAIVRSIEQGEGEAQTIVRDAVEDLDPGLVMVVGIAGAVPGELALGDVLFASHVHDLTLGAIDSDGIETFNVSGGPMLKAIQTEVANLLVTIPNALKVSTTMPVYPSIDTSSLAFTTDDDELNKSIQSKLEQRYLHRLPNILPFFTDGPIASSDRVIKQPALIKGWKQLLRKVVAVEMEMAGAYRAVRGPTKEYKLLSIRGMSDVIGLKRSGEWEHFACEIAAEFALAYIRSWKSNPLLKS